MNYKIDHCEPFDGNKENIWMKCEHVGRYLFAIDFFAKLSSKKILDVACAEGFGSYLLAKKGFEVFGADVNPEYVQTVSKRSRGTFVVLDFEKDDFPKEFKEFDGCVCFETIEHLDKGQLLLDKIHKCLKTGGHLIFSFPNCIYEKLDENGVNYDPFHKRIFEKHEMEEMVKIAGFEKVAEFGQSLCNMLYGAESDAVKNARLSSGEIDKLFKYDEKSIISFAKLFGYPNDQKIDESYSYIWILKKI